MGIGPPFQVELGILVVILAHWVLVFFLSTATVFLCMRSTIWLAINPHRPHIVTVSPLPKSKTNLKPTFSSSKTHQEPIDSPRFSEHKPSISPATPCPSSHVVTSPGLSATRARCPSWRAPMSQPAWR